MDRKIIFLDIDGTLVENGKKVSQKVVDAIQTVRKNGHYVIICTGRPKCGVKNLEYIGFDGYICSAGSYIEIDEKVIFYKELDKEYVTKARNCFEKNHVYYNLETIDAIYEDKKMSELFTFGETNKLMNSEMKRLLCSLKEEYNIHELEDYDESIGVCKMCFIAVNKQDLIEPKALLSQDFHFIIHDSLGLPIINGEIILKGFDKGKAVSMVCDHLNISLENTIGFGDSMNDLEMIKICKHGVVMENGNNELKTYATRICESVDNDGIYYELKRLCLI